MSSDSQNPMVAYIEKELKEHTEAELTELLLDGCKSDSIVGFEGRNFEKLNHLSFIGCGLKSLEGLTKLPEVRIIDLSENEVDSLEKIPELLPSLYHINICSNKTIKTIDQLKPLTKLEGLKALDLFDCPLAEEENHRQEIFTAIPQLKFLNGFDINDEEADELNESGESALGEGAEDYDSALEDDEEIGLDYLNSSKALKEDDSSADFDENKVNGKSKKRKANGASHDEPQEKKKSAEEA